jgi:hypothetical protein
LAKIEATPTTETSAVGGTSCCAQTGVSQFHSIARSENLLKNILPGTACLIGKIKLQKAKTKKQKAKDK